MVIWSVNPFYVLTNSPFFACQGVPKRGYIGPFEPSKFLRHRSYDFFNSTATDKTYEQEYAHWGERGTFLDDANLQNHFFLNEYKCKHLTFNIRRRSCPPIYLILSFPIICFLSQVQPCSNLLPLTPKVNMEA